jgi:hypothetical protein
MQCSEEVVLAVLNAPIEMASRVLGERYGVCRETVRKIRFGRSFAHLYPEIERLTVEQMARTCNNCIFFERKSKRKAWCNLGFPECSNPKFARGCGAYLDREAKK